MHLIDTLTSTMSITPWNRFLRNLYKRGENTHIADMLYLPTEDGSYDCELEKINMVSYVPIAEARLAEIKRNKHRPHSSET